MSTNVLRISPTVLCPMGVQFSPLILADRLISLAQEADRAGYRASAERLVSLVYAVLDDQGTCNTEAA